MTKNVPNAAEFILEQNAKKGATDVLDRMTALEKNMTPNGKTMIIQKVANTSLFRLAWAEGGQPVDGMYTGVDKAHRAMKDYLTAKWDEAEASATGAKG